MDAVGVFNLVTKTAAYVNEKIGGQCRKNGGLATRCQYTYAIPQS